MKPPPIILLLLGYGAGLATGLLRFGAPWSVGLVLVAVLWLGRRHWFGLVAAAAILGRGSAALSLWDESHLCSHRLPAAVRGLRGRLTEPLSATGRRARLLPLGSGCVGAVAARWPAGVVLPAGAVVTVSGRWLGEDDRGRSSGLLLVRRFDRTALRPGAGDRFRNWLGGAVRSLYGARTGTVEALVLGRRSGLPPGLRDRYARAGLAHILSISGFHVGIILGWMILLTRAAGLPASRAASLATLLAVGYVIFLGWPPPAARAVVLAGLAVLLKLRQRHVAPLTLLSAACLVGLLLDPGAVLEPGAWLSASALAGVLIACRWSDRALGTHWAWRSLAASVGATLATAPITAAVFGTVSLAGVGLNFLAIPVAAAAIPGLLASLLAFPVAPVLARPMATSAGLLLGLLDRLAWWGGRWDGLVVLQQPEPRSAIPWLLVLAAAYWGISGHASRWLALRRWALAGCVMSWALAGADAFHAVRDTSSGLTLHFLDVGQGDAAVIRTPAGHWVVVDAGPRGESDDAGRRVVLPFLARHRAAGVAFAVLSHAHADHLGGLPAVLARFRAGEVLEPADLVADPLYAGWLTQLDREHIPWIAARSGMAFTFDSVRFTVLHPDTAWSAWQDDLNEDSVVLLVEYRGFRALFAGDAGLVAEADLAGRVGPVDLLKVGHHGSRSATGDAWLDQLEPRVAVISCGRGNRYGHPHAEVLQRLARHGAAVWRTDQDGTIAVRVRGGRIEVEGRRRRAVFSLRPGTAAGLLQ